MNSIMGGLPQTKGRKVKLGKIIKLKHADDSTIYKNPLIRTRRKEFKFSNSDLSPI